MSDQRMPPPSGKSKSSTTSSKTTKMTPPLNRSASHLGMLPPRKRRMSLEEAPTGKRIPPDEITEEELSHAVATAASHSDAGVRALAIMLEAILALVMPQEEDDIMEDVAITDCTDSVEEE